MLAPLIAWGLQTLLWVHVKPLVWVFFYPAVFFSSLMGGLWCGLAATAVSTTVGWWFFIRPEAGGTVRFEIETVVFVLMGVLFAVFNERWWAAKRALEKRVGERTDDLEAALATLRQRKAELRMVTDTAHVGLVIVDARHRYRYANRTYCEILKLPTFDLVGRAVAEVLPNVYATQIRPRLERAFGGEKVEYLLHVPNADEAGTSRHFSVSYGPVMDGAERVVVVAIADVTARKQGEELAARLAAIVASSSDAIIGKDLEGIVTSWNAGAEAVFGFAAADMVGRPITRLIPAARIHEEQTILEHIRRGDPVRHFETQRQHADGRLLDVSITVSPIRDGEGKVVGASKVARDVTEAKRVQRALRESEERLRLAIDAARLGTWETNYRTGKLVWSTRQEEMMGFAPGTFPGTLEAFLALVHPDDRARLAEAQREAMKPGGSYQAELRFVRHDGSVRWGFVRGQVLRGPDGQPERMLGIELDVTERRQTEEAVRRLNAELEHRVRERTAQLESANKELESFSYTVSHDLRAPLRAINGFSLAVEEDYGALLPEEGRRFLQKVRDGASRMGRLIDDLLAFSRLGRTPLGRQAVDMEVIVRESLAELGWPIAGRTIELRAGSMPVTEADPALLKQVWVNLLSNALKHTRKRAHAVIETGCVEQGGETVFFVRDNGSGFDPRYAHKLFGVFQRLHRAEDYEGTGVGLAIVQRVVQRHGGRVWAESALESGATFYFTLGVVPPQP